MGLAILASFLLTIGLYFMKRQAERLPSLGGGWRPSSWLAFARDPKWVLGVVLQVGGYGLYLTALRHTPLSVVHTALNGGIAFFVVLAVFGLKEKPQPIEWLGVLAVAVGLLTLGLSSGPDTQTDAAGAVGATVFATLTIAAAIAALLIDARPGRSAGLSIASGLTLGLAGLCAKQLAAADAFGSALLSLPFVLTLLTNMVGFALMQGALQSGKGVVVVPIFSTLSNLVPIAAGYLVYGEPLPANPGQATLRLVSMALALGGAGVLGAAGER